MYFFFLSGNFKIFTATNVNNWITSKTINSSLSTTFSKTAIYLKDHDLFFSKISQHKTLKEYQTWFNIRFVNYIPKLSFYFCAYSLSTSNHMIALFQNHPGLKHLYGDFYSAFFSVPSISIGIPGQNKKHPGFIETQRNFFLPIFIPSHFLCKQLLRKSVSKYIQF